MQAHSLAESPEPEC